MSKNSSFLKEALEQKRRQTMKTLGTKDMKASLLQPSAQQVPQQVHLNAALLEEAFKEQKVTNLGGSFFGNNMPMQTQMGTIGGEEAARDFQVSFIEDYQPAFPDESN